MGASDPPPSFYMNFEKEPEQKEKSFDEIKAEMNGRGFSYAGLESLTITRLSEEARFEAMPFQTKEDIVKKYVEQYKDRIAVEVELADVPNSREGQEAVYVFIKKKE